MAVARSVLLEDWAEATARVNFSSEIEQYVHVRCYGGYDRRALPLPLHRRLPDACFQYEC